MLFERSEAELTRSAMNGDSAAFADGDRDAMEGC
jgi:hypothetical protein